MRCLVVMFRGVPSRRIIAAAHMAARQAEAQMHAMAACRQAFLATLWESVAARRGPRRDDCTCSLAVGQTLGVVTFGLTSLALSLGGAAS